ncbi:MAG: DUF4065 domain-containing protein [Corynebacterium sp.]|nr:DUF4065 domain-containing protein [Corynebacterium sp.]
MSVFPIAKYIIEKQTYVSTMKLHKLIFYSHALSLLENNKSLVDEDFQAWRNGPVLPSLFATHRGRFFVDKTKYADAGPLDAETAAIVDEVLENIGSLNGSQLSKKTHREKPWSDQRIGLLPGQHSQNAITNQAIKEAYTSKEAIFDAEGLVES